MRKTTRYVSSCIFIRFNVYKYVEFSKIAKSDEASKQKTAKKKWKLIRESDLKKKKKRTHREKRERERQGEEKKHRTANTINGENFFSRGKTRNKKNKKYQDKRATTKKKKKYISIMK